MDEEEEEEDESPPICSFATVTEWSIIGRSKKWARILP
jgi:hypothetical protein